MICDVTCGVSHVVPYSIQWDTQKHEILTMSVGIQTKGTFSPTQGKLLEFLAKLTSPRPSPMQKKKKALKRKKKKKMIEEETKTLFLNFIILLKE